MRGRESLAGALRTSEHGNPPIEWDLAIDIGDMSGGQTRVRWRLMPGVW